MLQLWLNGYDSLNHNIFYLLEDLLFGFPEEALLTLALEPILKTIR